MVQDPRSKDDGPVGLPSPLLQTSQGCLQPLRPSFRVSIASVRNVSTPLRGAQSAFCALEWS